MHFFDVIRGGIDVDSLLGHPRGPVVMRPPEDWDHEAAMRQASGEMILQINDQVLGDSAVMNSFNRILDFFVR